MQKYKLKDGRILEIHTDDTPSNPREEWDNLGIMACGHRRYDLGDKEAASPSRFDGWDEMRDFIEKECNAVAVLPLRLYDHSGISISTSSGYPFNCPWDSGMVGFIYATREAVEKMNGWKKMTKRRVAKVVEILESEVKVYDQYLRGDVYGFILKKPARTCPECGHEVEDEADDSCWGFFGSDHKESGLLDHAGITDAEFDAAEEIS